MGSTKATHATNPCLWHLIWDPTEETATRPLAIRKDGTWYCYGWDLTKNICEVFKPDGYIGTAYTYSPYGAAASTGTVTQPIQWSSEYHDADLGLVYYNYRHYNDLIGRWNRRDSQVMNFNEYKYADNNTYGTYDILGAATREQKKEREKERREKNNNNRKANKINQKIPKPFHGPANAVDVVNEICEAAEAINEIVTDSLNSEHDKGLDLCRERMKKEKDDIYGCCYIYLNASSHCWGNAKYAVYRLRKVQITIGFTCPHIEDNPGYYNRETLYDSGLPMEGIPKASNPNEIIIPPIFRRTV